MTQFYNPKTKKIEKSNIDQWCSNILQPHNTLRKLHSSHSLRTYFICFYYTVKQKSKAKKRLKQKKKQWIWKKKIIFLLLQKIKPRNHFQILSVFRIQTPVTINLFLVWVSTGWKVAQLEFEAAPRALMAQPRVGLIYMNESHFVFYVCFK